MSRFHKLRPRTRLPLLSNLGTASVPSPLATNELPAKQVAADVPERRPAMPPPRSESVVAPQIDLPATVPIEPRSRVPAPMQTSPSKPPPAQPKSAVPLAVRGSRVGQASKGDQTGSHHRAVCRDSRVRSTGSAAGSSFPSQKPCAQASTSHGSCSVQVSRQHGRAHPSDAPHPRNTSTRCCATLPSSSARTLTAPSLSVIEAEWNRRVVAKTGAPESWSQENSTRNLSAS